METKIIEKDNLTYVVVNGSINTNTSDQFELSLLECTSDNDGIIIDAKNVDYISSAGLRVILKTKKRCGNKIFKVINVCNDVKQVFDITGFSEIVDIESTLKEIDITNSKLIGAGACGECYRISDDEIVKLYFDNISDDEISKEKTLAKKAFVLGIPTAISYDIVECNGRKGVVYEMIKSQTMSELIQNDYQNKDKYLDMYSAVCKKIHSITYDNNDLPSYKEVCKNRLKEVNGISEEDYNYLVKLIEIIPNENHIIHGDLNMNNIMVENGECILIDMAELSIGSPLFDIANIIYSMKERNNMNDEINKFYKLKSSEVNDLFNGFIARYFNSCLDDAIKNYPNGKWIMPITYLRLCSYLLKKNKRTTNDFNKGLDILHNILIPFINAQS